MKANKSKVSMDILDMLNVQSNKNGTSIVFDKTYYYNDGLTDIKKGRYMFGLFTKQFIIGITKNGNSTLKIQKNYQEIIGKTYKEMGNNLDIAVTETEEMIPIDANESWRPKEVTMLIKAINSGALKVS